MYDIPTVALTPTVRLSIYFSYVALFLLGCLVSLHPKVKAHPRRLPLTFGCLSVSFFLLAPLFATDPNLREPAGSPIWENFTAAISSFSLLWAGVSLARLAFKSPEELERLQRKPLPRWAKAVQRPIAHSKLALVYLTLLATFLPIYGAGEAQDWIRTAGYLALVGCSSLSISRASLARERPCDAEGAIKLAEEGAQEEEKAEDVEERRKVLRGVRWQSWLFAVLCGATSVLAMGLGWVEFEA